MSEDMTPSPHVKQPEPGRSTAAPHTREIIRPGHTSASVTDQISAIVLTRRTPRGWYIGFGVAFLLVMVLLYAIAYLLLRGVGVWGQCAGSGALPSSILSGGLVSATLAR